MPIPHDFDQGRFLAALDTVPDLKELRAAYFDGTSLLLLRAGVRSRGAGARAVVVYEMTNSVAPGLFGFAPPRESRFWNEMLSTGLSCSAAVLGWMVVFGGAAAAPVTGGSSTIVSVLAWGAAGASSLQCANSAFRAGTELVSPETVDFWDSHEWYTRTAAALDVISLSGAAAAGGATSGW